MYAFWLETCSGTLQSRLEPEVMIACERLPGSIPERFASVGTSEPSLATPTTIFGHYLPLVSLADPSDSPPRLPLA